MIVTGPKSTLSWELADGTVLRVNEHTPAGHHKDRNGDDIWVVPGNAYPRYVQAPTGVTWDVAFNVRTSVRVGFLVSPRTEEPLPSAYLSALTSGERRYAMSDTDSTLALECSEDGPTRGIIRLAPERRLPLVVSWFAYEGDHLGSATERSARTNIGDRMEWRAESAMPPRQYPLALHTNLSFGEPRLVGRVLIDPSSKTVQVIQ
jgi:hypothetical protein